MVRALPRRELIAHERMVQIQALALLAARVVDAMARAQHIDCSAYLIGTHRGLGVQVQVDTIRQARELGRQRRRAHVDVGGLDGSQIGRGRRGQTSKRLVERDELGHEQVIPLAGRRRTHRQRRREAHAHVRRETLRDGIGQPRTAHDALNGMDYFEMAQVLKAVALAVANAQPKERGIVGQALTHARSPINTFLAWSVGQIPQPVHDVRVQSGVVTPSSERRYSRSRKPRVQPGLTCSQGRRQSSS